MVSVCQACVVRTCRQLHEADAVLQGEIACPMCAGRERFMGDVQQASKLDAAGPADKANMVPPDLTWLDEL